MNTKNKFPTRNLGGVHTSPYVETLDRQTLRCRKIILKPTKKQRSIIKQWFKWYRYGYNQAIRLINELKFNGDNTVPGFKSLRKMVRNQMSKNTKHNMAQSKIPTNTFDNSIHDVVKAYKTAFALKKSGHIKYFRVRYKKATAPKETLVLEPSAFSKITNGFVVRTLGETMISIGGDLCGIRHASRLQYNKRNGELILYVPEDRSIKKVDCREEWCSLDPGIRTFQTLYSGCQTYGNGATSEYGKEEPIKMKKLLEQINKYKEFEGKPGCGWYTRFARKRYQKIQNLRDELHWKTALELVRSYDKILIGSMSTKSIVSKKKTLNKCSKQLAYSLGHYLFKCRLESKAEEYGAQVVVVNEAYTSKTCGKCSNINPNLGGNKTFSCPRSNCNYTIDRDVNGARNISLKHFGLFNPKF